MLSLPYKLLNKQSICWRFKTSRRSCNMPVMLFLDHDVFSLNVFSCSPGHVPIHPQSCSVESLCWNYTEVLSIFHKYGCVMTYLCGHDHPGGQYRDEHGILYLTLPGLVEARPGKEDYGTVHTFKDRMELHGHGRVPSMTLVRW